MSDRPLTAVVMCGGSGKRLWPLSRRDFPKQFMPLVGGKSLLELTFERVRSLNQVEVSLCVGSEAHRFMIGETLDRAGLAAKVLLEPEGRNTAPALACAALEVSKESPEAILVCMPSDHYIPEVEPFKDSITKAAELARAGWWVTLGVEPGFASTAYGYVDSGEPINGSEYGTVVERFVEKPSKEVAEQYLRDGYYWNAGISIVGAAELLAAYSTHAPDILDDCHLAMASTTQDERFVRVNEEAFLACRSESVDYSILEHHERTAMVRHSGLWSDVGSWNAVSSLALADVDGNSMDGDARFIRSANTFVHSPHRHTVTLGVRDLVVVDTPDALLVADKSQLEHVGDVVSALSKEARPEASTHKRVVRPWGAFESIDEGKDYQVKRLTISSGSSLSLQSHQHRAEHWVVVQGCAEVTKEGEVFDLGKNESTYIPVGTKHRLANRGAETLEIIEVQTGSYLGEDDIIRYEDEFGRADSCGPGAQGIELGAPT